jgi:uncharacterized membrane protein YraQ (UPF0718 family)
MHAVGGCVLVAIVIGLIIYFFFKEKQNKYLLLLASELVATTVGTISVDFKPCPL